MLTRAVVRQLRQYLELGILLCGYVKKIGSLLSALRRLRP